MKKWVIAEKKSDDLIEQLLINRKISSGQWQSFLNLNYEIDLHNPRLLNDAEISSQRILNAIDNKEKIGIFTDYDADGIPGAALLCDFLSDFGALKNFCYIPSRKEGYGLSKAAIDKMVDEKVNLLITIDSGITAKKEVEYAKSKNIDVIITDHHEIQEKFLPKAYGVINPKLSSKYPFKDLCGCGVIFKLCQMLSILRPEKVSPDRLKWYLDLVALSTICDIVPLIGENRVLAKYGLIVMQKTRRIGLKELYKVAGIEPLNINPYIVGFQIGPRINAGGRLDNSLSAFELLTCKNEEQAAKLASELNNLNVLRQKILSESLEKALEKVEKNRLADNKIIVVADEEWLPGIIGLIAGKLTEKFSRPTIVFGKEGDSFVGSARSVTGLHLVDALTEVADMLSHFGGHEKAAGLSLPEKNFDKFYEKILKIGSEKLSEEDLLQRIHIDTEVKISDIDYELYKKLVKLEPYGLGNPKPVFIAKNVTVSDSSLVGEGKHLRLKFVSKDKGQLKTISGIGFNLGPENNIKPNDKVDIVFNIDEDNWAIKNSYSKSLPKVQLKILDIRKSEQEKGNLSK